MRLTKSDPSGYYAYFTDGTSPASDVLSDNFSTFTPGVSETKGIGNGQYASVFYLADASGNSRGLLNGSQSVTDGYNWDAFGTLMSRYGSHPTGYAWRAGSGYQTDNDTGLKLLGHRYYDTRIGRFLSQDPAGDGDNWYAYAGNDPVNNTDPTGLYTFIDPGMVGTPGDPGQFAPAGSSAGDGTWDQYQSDGQGGWKYLNTVVHGGAWDQMNGSSMGPGGFFMPQKGNVGDSRGLGGLNDELKGIQKALNDGGISKSERQAKENAIQKLEDAIKRTKKGLGQKGSRANKEAKTPPLSNEERAARDAAKAERRAAFESERAQLLDDAAVDTLELDAAEGALILDEGIIGIGIIVK